MPVQKGYVATSLGQIHYRQQGAGNCVVLLGQSGRSSRMHRLLMDALAPRYSVVAFDLPGTGESVGLQHGTSFEAIAEALVGCIQTLKLGAVNLYGIHTGNKIGAAMAAMSPASVRRFVFAGQSHSIIPDQLLRNDTIRRAVASVVGSNENGPGKVLLDWAEKLAQINTFGLSRGTLVSISQRGEVEEPLERIVDEFQAMVSRAPMYEGNFAYDLGRDLRRLSMPTLVLEIVTPEEDRMVGRQGQAVVTLLQRGDLVEMTQPDGHGHTLEDRASAVADILTGFFN